INAVGLSDTDSKVKVTYYPAADDVSSVIPGDWQMDSQLITCRTMRGDVYCEQNNIHHIHLLKIDTEGHEINVIDGFQKMLNCGKIHAIQFEYGHTWLPPRKQLRDAYELLVPMGYKIGRLYPRGVDFCQYSNFRDEHYRMGNYVAIHESQKLLLKMLQETPSSV
ncbi:MAG: FkbM family methyltransferase, partial [Bacilli bacterium]|nr:FkbM family methyltransferase [Bacilli bacterium]